MDSSSAFVSETPVRIMRCARGRRFGVAWVVVFVELVFLGVHAALLVGANRWVPSGSIAGKTSVDWAAVQVGLLDSGVRFSAVAVAALLAVKFHARTTAMVPGILVCLLPFFFGFPWAACMQDSLASPWASEPRFAGLGSGWENMVFHSGCSRDFAAPWFGAVTDLLLLALVLLLARRFCGWGRLTPVASPTHPDQGGGNPSRRQLRLPLLASAGVVLGAVLLAQVTWYRYPWTEGLSLLLPSFSIGLLVCHRASAVTGAAAGLAAIGMFPNLWHPWTTGGFRLSLALGSWTWEAVGALLLASWLGVLAAHYTRPEPTMTRTNW